MSDRESKNKKERIQFLDCYALRHSENGSTATLKRRRKKVAIKLPDEVNRAIEMVKNQGFTLIEIKNVGERRFCLSFFEKIFFIKNALR